MWSYAIKIGKRTSCEEAFSSPLHHGVAEDGDVLGRHQLPVLVHVRLDHLRLLEDHRVALRAEGSHHHEGLDQKKSKINA